MNTTEWRNASPASLNAWRYFKTLLGANPVITPLYFQGALPGSEFTTYNIKKLYFALEFGFTSDIFGGIIQGYIINYDAANAAVGYYCVDLPVGITFVHNEILIKNLISSRVNFAQYDFVRFNGYRVTWP
jgi:hypothetical protein